MSDKIPNLPNGFAFKTGFNSDHEVATVCFFCNEHKIPRQFFRKVEEIPEGWLPVGNVDWVTGALGRTIKPDYFPEFLKGYVQRRVWETDKWPIGHRVFIKPSDTHKRFTGFVTNGTWKGKKRGPYLCSEIVEFTNEWRYYVVNGEIVAAKWYWGDEKNTPEAPKLEIQWPEDWCGTADFGTYSDGRLALVEAHPPFSTGWYDSVANNEPYVRWLCAGWQWLNR